MSSDQLRGAENALHDAIDRYMRNGGDPESLQEIVTADLEWWRDELAAGLPER